MSCVRPSSRPSSGHPVIPSSRHPLFPIYGVFEQSKAQPAGGRGGGSCGGRYTCAVAFGRIAQIRIWNLKYNSQEHSNLSYASKRDCASIAPHTNLTLVPKYSKPLFFRASGRDKTLAAERFLIFAAKTSKLKNQFYLFETCSCVSNRVLENALFLHNKTRLSNQFRRKIHLDKIHC